MEVWIWFINSNKAIQLRYVLQNTASKKLVKAGFLDPYYNYREDEETLNDYKRKILLSKTSNTEAFLRIMLVHLRKLILDNI